MARSTGRGAWLLLMLLLGPAVRAPAQGLSDVVSLPEFVLTEGRIALDEPAASFAAPVSALRFEPRIDLQTRNFGEAQGDITLRGGIFEGTAIQVNGLTLFDPQTGHYAAELPIPPAMLGSPLVVTGVEHAFGSFNATAGTVGHDWRRVETGGRVSVGFGNGSLRRYSVHAGRVLRQGGAGEPRVGIDGEFAGSRADGLIMDGDHDFSRLAGRVEIVSDTGLTQLFAGHQSKFFGWPNLYTPLGLAETEQIRTTLLILTHRTERGDAVFEASGYHRRNTDDYELDRHRPGLFNAYEHETRVSGAAARFGVSRAGWELDFRGELAADSIESTSLVAGRFNSRTYWKLGALASRPLSASRPADDGGWQVRLGATLDGTNRDGSRASPLVELEWNRELGATPALRVYAQFSEASRVPGYTALNSPPDAGLFRGNPDLGREAARNVETGVQLATRAWSVHAAVFRRSDDPLVDWTFNYSADRARTAREMGLATLGVELVAARTWDRLRLVLSYGWLDKDADYFGEAVDASFYALNFARHRLTLALTARLGGGFELRSDNECRLQEPNALRTVGGDSAVLSSLGLFWIPPGLQTLELSLVADNLWQSGFQEIPAVPAPGRQVTAGASWQW